jgi:transposase
MRLESRQHPSVKAALTHMVEILKEEVKRLEREIKLMVQQIAPELLALCGVGPVLAGTLLAEGGNIGRFPREDSFACYCGAAPIPWESGIGKRVRVNPGGNRRLNAALHLIALTRLRVDAQTRRFWERKISEGKTKREVLRVLKTYLAREIYHVLKSIFVPLSLPDRVPV